MALKGQAFLALWNDIAPAREAEYDQWHTIEHVPERVSVNGIHSGRRYVNRERSSHRYFTLYDVENLDVFDSPEYVDLLKNPTPWSAAMRPDFSNFVRATCAVKRSSGIGIGAAIGLLAVHRARATDDQIDRAVTSMLASPKVTSVHWGSGQGGPPTVPWQSAPTATVESRVFDSVIAVEALDRSAAETALVALRELLGATELPGDFGNDVYDLTFVFPGAGAGERAGHRRRAWDRN